MNIEFIIDIAPELVVATELNVVNAKKAEFVEVNKVLVEIAFKRDVVLSVVELELIAKEVVDLLVMVLVLLVVDAAVEEVVVVEMSVVLVVVDVGLVLIKAAVVVEGTTVILVLNSSATSLAARLRL